MTDPTRAREPAWQLSARRLVESDTFQNTIVAVIIADAITIGVQTYPIPGWLHTLTEWTDRVFHELRAALDTMETKLQQSGMVERSTAGAEEIEHWVEDHLHRPHAVAASRPEPRR
jgi:hypothetical protein